MDLAKLVAGVQALRQLWLEDMVGLLSRAGINGATVDTGNLTGPVQAHTHTHASTTGKTTDDHHAQAHDLFGGDHPDVDDTDVPADGEVLTYDEASGKWKSAPAPGASGMSNPMTSAGDLIVGGGVTEANWATPANGASITVIDTAGGYVADNVIDGNDATYWASSTKVNQSPWFRIDLGQARTITQHRLYDYTGGWHATQYKIESSDNDSDWTLRYTSPAGLSGGDTGLVALDSEATARYWKFTALAGSTIKGWNVYTAELRNTGTDPGTPLRLPIGSNGQFLGVAGGAVGWRANPVTAHVGESDPHTSYQKESEKGQANGYASLDAGTKVPTAELGGAGADATKFLRGDQTWQAVAAGSITVREQDGDPSVGGVSTIEFATGTTVADQGGGVVRVTPPAGGTGGGANILEVQVFS